MSAEKADRASAPSSVEMPATAEATIVVFGASGDLTARKLLPALYTLWAEGYLSDRAPIVGVARQEKTDEAFRNEMLESVSRHARTVPLRAEPWKRFARRLCYRQLDLSDPSGYVALDGALTALEQEAGLSGNRLVYLATAPELFLSCVSGLSQAGMIPDADADRWLRVVVEKPFGHDLSSAQAMTHDLGRLLREDQIYRIDHYLGKETVQNILLFRFGNAIFEPLLNRNHVDHVQITVAESQGIERSRGAYYDKAGALRDVLQNHVLQLLCLTAMEPPALFQANEIRDEKLKVLQALAPPAPSPPAHLAAGESPGAKWGSEVRAAPQSVVAGQYTAGEIDGQPVRGYQDEDRIDRDSRRETYVAMEVRVDNWRWAGVPFYLRTGKRLAQRVTEIAVQFKLPPLNLFTTVECEGTMCALVEARPNTLIFRIQPREAISLTCSTKRPGMQYQIHPVTMDFVYESAFAQGLPEAYERLLLDVLRGDSTLFTRSDELEAAWRFVTPVLDAWERDHTVPEPYTAGTWGPAAADELLAQSGRHWRTPVVRD